MEEFQPLTFHRRGEIAAVEWAPARNRGGFDAPARGPIADFLRRPEVERMAASRFDGADASDENPVSQLWHAVDRDLGPFGCSAPDLLMWTALWNVVDKPVRRALIGLSVLSDHGCLLNWEARKAKIGRLDRDLLSAMDSAATGGLEFREWKRLSRTWDRRRSELSPRRTNHLVRPGGLVETDLGWLAGVGTRASRRRVRAQLEELGAVERRESRGRQPRFIPGTKPVDVFGHQVAVNSMQELGSLTAKTAKATVKSRWRHFKPGPGVYRSGERWASTMQGLGTYIVGAEVPPSVARFFAHRLTPLIQSIGEAESGRTGEKGVYRWWGRVAREHSPVALVIRLR